MRFKFGALAVVFGTASLLAGCQTGVPQAENFPNQRQFIVMSTAQWQVLADWTVTQLVPSLPANKRINVHAPSSSAFSKSFAEFLATDLVRRGYIVGPGDNVPTLHFNAQVVDHGGLISPAPLTFTLVGTLAGAGTWLAHYGARGDITPDAAPAIGLGIGALVDADRAFLPQPTDAEVTVTSSLTNAGQRYAGRSDVFYIAGSDSSEYQPSGEPDQDLIISQENR